MDGRDDRQPATPADPLDEFLRTRQAYHEARGRVLVAYLPWLDQVVGAVIKLLPRRIERGEVRSEAVNAFLDLLDRFDPNLGVLVNFARPRIVGAIGDWVRRARKTQAHFSLDEALKEEATGYDG